MILRLATAFMLCYWIGGCAGDTPEQGVFDAQTEALDRARDVQTTLDNRADEIGRRLGNEQDEEDPR